MAAAPCCPPGSHGPATADAAYSPAGSWEAIAGLEVYVVGQRAGAKSVLLGVSDVFGPRTGRHVRICDEMAEAVPGSLVVMPDLFHGCPIAAIWPGPISLNVFGSLPLLHRIRYRCGWANVWPETEALLDAVRVRMQVGEAVPVAAFGFCWGAWLAIKGGTTGRFAACVGFHPSLVCSKLQRHPDNTDDDSMARSMQCPVLLLPAGNDAATLKPGGVFLEVLQKVQPASRSREYADMLHGWVNRGTESDCMVQQACSAAAVAEAQASALCEAAGFLLETLGRWVPRREGSGGEASSSSESDSSSGSGGEEACCA